MARQLRALATFPEDLPGFGFQHPHGGVQQSVILVLGNQTPSSGPCRHYI